MARLHPVKESSGSISNKTNLCFALDITVQELDDALSINPESRYSQSTILKKDGSDRVVNNPHYLIRKIQRRINKRIFSNQDVISWPDHIFGSIPNDELDDGPAAIKDYVNCCRQHCGARSVITIDIKDFFDNISRSLVLDIFEGFLSYPKDVAEILTDICCKGGRIVQGALTSSYIASLCLWRLEGDVVKRLGYKSLVYTRLVDDINISSKIWKYDFSYAAGLVEDMLREADLPINSSKTRVQYSSIDPMLVHGLRVDFPEPRLPPDEPRRIRANVKDLELRAATPGYRASRAYRKDFNRCLGRLNKLGRVNHQQHKPLLKRVARIKPLPSHMDIERAERLITRLERDALKPGYMETIWFYKRFNVASQRLVILKRSFPKTAEDFRNRINRIKPLWNE